MRTEWMQEFRQDFGFALRGLRKAPGFALVAALTLALGIGANTAIFSVVRGILLRPLPFADPGRLVMVASTYQGQRSTSSPANSLDWRDQNKSFTGISVVGEPLRGAHRFGRARAASGLRCERRLLFHPRRQGHRRARRLPPRGGRLAGPQGGGALRDRLAEPFRQRPQAGRLPDHPRQRAVPGGGRGAGRVRVALQRGDVVPLHHGAATPGRQPRRGLPQQPGPAQARRHPASATAGHAGRRQAAGSRLPRREQGCQRGGHPDAGVDHRRTRHAALRPARRRRLRAADRLRQRRQPAAGARRRAAQRAGGAHRAGRRRADAWSASWSPRAWCWR